MNSNTHPVELLIVLLLEMVEGIAWFVNEFTGGHATPTKKQATRSPRDLGSAPQTTEKATHPKPAHITHMLNTDIDRVPALDAQLIKEDEPWSVTCARINSLPGAATAYVNNWTEYVHALTVKELRQLTGKSNNQFNKASLQYMAMCL